MPSQSGPVSTRLNTALHHQMMWESVCFLNCLVAHGEGQERVREFFICSAAAVSAPSGPGGDTAATTATKIQVPSSATGTTSPGLRATSSPQTSRAASSSQDRSQQQQQQQQQQQIASPSYSSTTGHASASATTIAANDMTDAPLPEFTLPASALPAPKSQSQQQQQQLPNVLQSPGMSTASTSMSKHVNPASLGTEGDQQQQQQQQQHAHLHFFIGRKHCAASTRATRPPFSTKAALQLCPFHSPHVALFSGDQSSNAASQSQQSMSAAVTKETQQQQQQQQAQMKDFHSNSIRSDSSRATTPELHSTDFSFSYDQDQSPMTTLPRGAGQQRQQRGGGGGVGGGGGGGGDWSNFSRTIDHGDGSCPYGARCEFLHCHDPLADLVHVSRRSSFFQDIHEFSVITHTKDRKLFRVSITDAEVTAGLLLLCYLQQTSKVTAALKVCSYYQRSSSSSCKYGRRCMYAHVAKAKLVRVGGQESERPIDAATTVLQVLSLTLPLNVAAVAAKQFDEVGLKRVGDVQTISDPVFGAVMKEFFQTGLTTSGNERKAIMDVADSRETSQQQHQQQQQQQQDQDDSMPKPSGTRASFDDSDPQSDSHKRTDLTSPIVTSPAEEEEGTPTQLVVPRLGIEDKSGCVLALESLRFPPPSVAIGIALSTFPGITKEMVTRFSFHHPTVTTVEDLLHVKLRNLLGTPQLSVSCLTALEMLRKRLEVDEGGPKSFAIDKLPLDSMFRFFAKKICKFRAGHAHHSWRKKDDKRPIVTSVITFVNPESCRCSVSGDGTEVSATRSSQQQQQQQQQHHHHGVHHHQHRSGGSSYSASTSQTCSAANSASHAVKQQARAGASSGLLPPFPSEPAPTPPSPPPPPASTTTTTTTTTTSGNPNLPKNDIVIAAEEETTTTATTATSTISNSREDSMQRAVSSSSQVVFPKSPSLQGSIGPVVVSQQHQYQQQQQQDGAVASPSASSSQLQLQQQQQQQQVVLDYDPFSSSAEFTIPAPPGHWCSCPRAYEIGVNYELSTPAGSRCSEQNVMGKIASNGLPTHAIREVFVHGSGVKVDPNPLFPCGVCENMFKRISSDVQSAHGGGQVMLYMFDHMERPKKFVCMAVHEISHRQGTTFKRFVEEDLREEEE